MGGLIATIFGEVIPKWEAGKYVNQRKLVRPERFELEPVCGRERSGSPQAKSRAERGISVDKDMGESGAPGEIRTPDLQLRSVNQEDFNTVTRLAFLQLSESPFGGILWILLPSCAHLTYSANTQQVSLGCSLANKCRFPGGPAFGLLVWINNLTSGVRSGFRIIPVYLGRVCAMAVQ